MNSTTGLPLDPKTDSPFGFIPTLGVTIVFIVLFSLTTGERQSLPQLVSSMLTEHALLSFVAVHLFQSIRYRVWWWLPTVFTCGIVEIIGWAGRAWGSQNPWSLNPYLMQ